MAISRCQNAVRLPKFRINSSLNSCRRRRGGCSPQFLVVVTLFAVVMTSFVTGTYAQEPIIYQPQQDSEPSYVAGSHMLTLWSQPSDVGGAIAQFGGVQECSEHINARVDSEFFEGDLLSSCKQEAAGYDVKELLQLSEAIVAPSEEQTTRLCRAESCAAWLSQAAEATWLPESEPAFQPAEYQGKYCNEVGSPVMVARQLSAQEDFSLMGSGDNPQLSAAVEPPGSSSGTTESTRSSSSGSSSSSLSTSNSASVSSGSSSSSNSNSVGDDFLSGSNFNSSDTAGFTSSGVGPHASSTATTTELTPSYAYVVGAWVLFNGSYFFLMRRK
ncbi:hypothetical protein GQ600_8174 [Phytophthora cactorum]|nr:hypothetical protein GQ600_8174 [Phytophthora cactorum]